MGRYLKLGGINLRVVERRKGKPFILEIDGIYYKRMSEEPIIEKKGPDKLQRKKRTPKKDDLFKAKIMYMGREMVLGEYKTAEEAELAEIVALENLGL